MWQHVFLQAVKRTIDLIRHGDKEHIHKQNVILLVIKLAIKEKRRKSGWGEEDEGEETGLWQTKENVFLLDCVSLTQRSTPVVRN